MVLTENGYKLAKDITEGDILVTLKFENIEMSDSGIPNNANSLELGKLEIQKSKVNGIIENNSSTIIFNDRQTRQVSLTESVLIKRDGRYQYSLASEVKIGDLLVSYVNNDIIEISVTSIEYVEAPTRVLQFAVDLVGLIIAEDMIVHNAKYLQKD